jgi:tetratricopeptide (TPR) repeat protein
MKQIAILASCILLLISCTQTNPAEEYYKKGDATGRLKDYKDAIIEYNKAIALNPNMAKAYNERAI